jgi:hypothetical protein
MSKRQVLRSNKRLVLLRDVGAGSDFDFDFDFDSESDSDSACLGGMVELCPTDHCTATAKRRPALFCHAISIVLTFQFTFAILRAEPIFAPVLTIF